MVVHMKYSPPKKIVVDIGPNPRLSQAIKLQCFFSALAAGPPPRWGGCAVQPAPSVGAHSWNGSCSASAIPDASWLPWQAEGCLGMQETQAVSKLSL